MRSRLGRRAGMNRKAMTSFTSCERGQQRVKESEIYFTWQMGCVKLFFISAVSCKRMMGMLYMLYRK